MKPTSVPNVNKLKKSNKEREKGTSQFLGESSSQSAEASSSSNQESGNYKYAGLGVESLQIYNEQSTFETLSDEVSAGLTEDLNYKLRQIIHEASIKATLSKRNYISSDDINNVFETLNIEKVYGAPSTPNWLPLGESNLLYLDDTEVNLVEISEQGCTGVQPGKIKATNKWLIEPSNDFTEAQKTYFITVCNCLIDDDKDLRIEALNDLKTNNKIGPITDWFYQFGYSLLSKDVTYNGLTLYALDFIEALENNCVAQLSVSEKNLDSLVRLILQRLFQPYSIEIIKPICKLLIVMCQRVPLYYLVKEKIMQKFLKIRCDYAVQMINLINSLGTDEIMEILIPNLDYFLDRVEEYQESELINALLETYNILCCEHECHDYVKKLFYEYFGESTILFYRNFDMENKDCVKHEINWFPIKLQLMKSRRKVAIDDRFLMRKYHRYNDVFPEVNDDNIEQKIKFKFINFKPSIGRTRFLKAAPIMNFSRKHFQSSSSSNLIIGRISLLNPSFKKSSTILQNKRSSYNINQYIL